MNASILSTPFPNILNGKMHPGSLFDWSTTCKQCHNQQCATPKDGTLLMCSYGFNYQHVTDELIIAGFIASDYKATSKSRSKNFTSLKHLVVKTDHINNFVERARIDCEEHQNQITSAKDIIIDEYIRTEQYKKEFLDKIRFDIQKGLSFAHDYKQINSQIAQNINVVIETRYSGEHFDEKLSRATHEERAIYWASKFLQEKLSVTRFLLNPDWITKESEKSRFRFHGLLLKYLRIYETMFAAKNIKATVTGRSTGELYYNSEAVGIIPHTLLDNALKYSRQNGKVTIHIDDESNGIFFSVSSFGPRIKDGEKEKIFWLFQRGEEAERIQEEGAGYGLYIAQMVANCMNTAIQVDQETAQKPKLGHWTTFSVLLPYL